MTFQTTLAALQSTIESVTPSLQKQPTDDPTSDLLTHPDQLSGRSYIEIRPAETPVEPETVSRAMGVLRSTLEDATKNGLRHKLTGSTHQPVVEWLLVSDGRLDTSIRYLVGDGNTDILPDIKNALRTALPNSYELQEIAWHPRRVHEHLPVPADEHATPSHPSITATAPYVPGNDIATFVSGAPILSRFHPPPGRIAARDGRHVPPRRSARTADSAPRPYRPRFRGYNHR